MANTGYGIKLNDVVLLGGIGAVVYMLWKSGVFKITNAVGDVVGAVGDTATDIISGIDNALKNPTQSLKSIIGTTTPVTTPVSYSLQTPIQQAIENLPIPAITPAKVSDVKNVIGAGLWGAGQAGYVYSAITNSWEPFAGKVGDVWNYVTQSYDFITGNSGNSGSSGNSAQQLDIPPVITDWTNYVIPTSYAPGYEPSLNNILNLGISTKSPYGWMN